MMDILRLNDISISFGGLKALSNVNLQLKKGEIKGLIGPNGSGKSTLLNVISGIYRPDAGDVFLEEEKITHSPPHKRVAKGIGRTFQHRQTFSHMTVLENVMTGLHKNIKTGLIGEAFRVKQSKEKEKIVKKKSLEALKFFGMQDKANRLVIDVASVEQRMVEIARVLVADHKILLLDEPAAGLSPAMVTELDGLLKKIRDEKGVSILLVEHVIALVLAVSESVTVLNFGSVIAEGKPEDTKKNPTVLEAYLGEKESYA